MKYCHENLTFTIFNTQISSSNFNTGKFPDWEGGMLMAAKSNTPYILTSSLASVTKARFRHGATGGNRGWKFWAKGDGDTDWVLISDKVANPQQGSEVDCVVNKTNCQLKFTNITSNQNAYLFQLEIFGNVDMSKAPALGAFTVNGKEYQSADVFTEDANGEMAGTVEISKKEQMVSEDNAVTLGSPDNGTIESTIYKKVDNQKTKVTIVVKAGEEAMTYRLTVAYKPDYTLTYYNTDGNVLGTQVVEKDAAITTLRNDEGVTVADGYKYRGWFEESDGRRKYTTADIITKDISLYAVATEIETASTTKCYSYNLKDDCFYADDHEAFSVEGNGAYHDSTHGWMFKAGDKINLLVGGNANIILGLCQYSKGTINSSDGQQIDGKASKDGDVKIVKYTGNASTLPITIDGGDIYLHSLSIANITNVPVEKNSAGYYVVKAGDANNLLNTIDEANANASDSRTFIFVPDRTYDLGETVLTNILGNNISIIGQSMHKTVIRNAPDVKNEGIGTTATLLVTGSNLYLQDLTLQNALDYYSAGNAGRAVCLQDKGTGTVCKNVKMLSYQGTCYSNNQSGQYYFEDCEIHGVVDYLCGSGDVYYNRCTFINEKRSEATIVANREAKKFGYVMQNCVIENNADSYNFGRSWDKGARLAWLNTTLKDKDNLLKSRFKAEGMNYAAEKFVEYNSIDENGNGVFPASNILTFTKGETNTMETILTAEQAAEYALDKVFTDWQPDQLAAQKPIGSITVVGSNLTWSADDDAKAYAIFYKGELKDIVSDCSYSIADGGAKDYTVRAANLMGGFGKSASTATGISNVTIDRPLNADAPMYNIAGQHVGEEYRGRVIRNGKKLLKD